MMGCASGCCGPPVENYPTYAPQTPIRPDDTHCAVKDLILDRASEDDISSCTEYLPLSLAKSVCNDGNRIDRNDLVQKQCGKSTTSVSECCQASACSVPLQKAKKADCCNSVKDMEGLDDDRCRLPEVTLPVCQDGCCIDPAETSQGENWGGVEDNQMDNKCCTTESVFSGYGGSGIDETEELPDSDSERPTCCKGRASPCCDESCLDRIALRECKSDDQTARADKACKTPSTLSRSCENEASEQACGRHAQSTRDKYAVTLAAIGCICRALLALGQESCCGPEKRPPIRRKLRSMNIGLPRGPSTDSCCATRADLSTSATNVRPRSEKCACSAGPSTIDSTRANRMKSCDSVCCTGQKTEDHTKESRDISTDVIEITDLEKGISSKEHIVLSVSGMTCTGCETKLKRTLGTIQSVRNLKTSLVLARAEFDLDVGGESTTEIMKHLERTTEFKCKMMMNQGSSIELILTSDPFSFVQQKWPRGVTNMTVLDEDKRTLNVAFDAKIVGARDLVEKGWATPLRLAAPCAHPTLEAGGRHVRHVGYTTLLSIVLTIPVLVLAWTPLPEHEIVHSSVSLALATIVQFVIAGPFYPKALKSLIYSRMVEMDLLIVLSTSAAFVFSVVSFGYLAVGLPFSSGQFFATSTLLVTLIMVGRYVSALARQKAVESISIRSLQISTATLVAEGTGAKRQIDTRLLQYGDVFEVCPDSKIPTDGTVISGFSEINESMITGESRPVEKHTGSPVIAGSINGSGTLIVRLSRLPCDNTISTIAELVDQAKLSKPKIQDIADRVASYFVPVIVLLTIITFAIWVTIGVTVRKQSGVEAAIQATTYAITVLIVSCPCAIGLAVPMVIVIASGVAAERGIIFKSADSIEVAYKTAHVVFDKTGTLTEGKLSVTVEEFLGDDTFSAAALFLGMVESNKHPVSAAVAEHLKVRGTTPSVVSNLKSLTGKGVEGTASGMFLRAGNSRWLNLSTNPRVQSILRQGYTVFCFTVNDELTAVLGLEDSLRPDARHTITKLRERGISVHIVSGDDDGAVRSASNELGIPESNVRSRCSPVDKQSYIQKLLALPAPEHAGKLAKTPVVMFCGDGTNDAIALAQATIGVHMSEGTDVAKSAADVVLLRPSLVEIPNIITISQKSITRIKFNFGWSFIYNFFAILLGAGAFVNVRIPPQFAGLGELVSVLPVIAAAVLLRWSKI